MFAFRSFIGRLREVAALGSDHADGFKTARSETDLFPQTQPDVDGEQCLRDCEDCVAKLPAKFQIDESKHLFGHIKPYQRHLIVATGKSDWVPKVHDDKGSVMEAVAHHDHSVTGGRLMLSASNMPVPDSGAENGTRCLLLPAFVFIDNITPSNVPDLINDVINSTSTNISKPSASQSNGSPQLSTGPQFQIKQCPYDYLILICSHKTRDARCGQAAPLVKKELERHLRPLGLLRDMHDERPGGVGIFFTSHVGGHKFAANMLVYRRAGTPGAECSPKEDSTAEVPPKNMNGAAENVAGSQADGVAPMPVIYEPESQKAVDAVISNGSPAPANGAVVETEIQKSDVGKTENGAPETGSLGDATAALAHEAQGQNGSLENGSAGQVNRATLEVVTIGSRGDENTENGASMNGAPTQSDKSDETKQEEKRPEVGQCIWLSRVRPQDCQNIVNYTILQGKVVKPKQQLRGGFDRCKQLVSW